MKNTEQLNAKILQKKRELSHYYVHLLYELINAQCLLSIFAWLVSMVTSILFCWSVAGFVNLLTVLIAKGAKVDEESDFGTPVQRAASKGQKETTKFSLDNKANVS